MSYFGCRKIAHIERELRELRASGWDYVVFTYTETDLLFYEGLIKEAFALARDLGLEVWADPWGVAGVFSGETASWFVSYSPGAWQVRDDGVPVPHACPNAPETREFMRRWIDAAAAAGAEWVLWDEPHFWSPGADYWPGAGGEGRWACRCRRCRERFSRRYGEEMPVELTPAVEEFRRASMVSFLRELIGYAAERELKNAVCWVPPELLPSGISLEEVAGMPGVDAVAVDPYWLAAGRTREDFFGPYVRRALSACRRHGKPLQVWLQGFRVPRGREGELLEAARDLAGSGVEYLAVWHHNGMSSLLPEDPDALERVIAGIVDIARRS